MINIQLDKKKFLAFLQDEDIKKKILEITSTQSESNESTNEAKNLEEKIKQLQEILQSKEKKIEEISKIITNQMDEINSYKIKLEDYNYKIQECIFKNEEYKKENKQLEKSKNEINNLLINEKEKYKNISNIYRIYKNLTYETKEEIKGIFKKESVENFLFCGAQFENLQMLWDYIKNKIIENKSTDVDNLKLIFDYFFDQYNKIHDEEIYSRLYVNKNDEFDTDIHTRSSESKASGYVKEILLVGYKNKYTNNIERKSVVLL